ncbi:cobalt ECF transporter T component CbiQ [Blastococcus sp. MG754426]|uniref:cobalt ECF transporter T component CbiQ n=1 Tax=unclassified Blastococcus TaxID=2619396 RepID=UPI001EEFB6B9|nr:MULTISPECIES: cobalt ECF transporter T component CbiQ [unclassified Blastococcus]MCF6510044.1 cobalt ECF transporter T component CbiQ [Blastococcus sp. MG754426]MCF6514343.1 cobalt ECF transporter T component CbiQ [Blastococcus sp. MG754427]MCF6737505.1 cobalt ECF transporter T component CbiQ [Blastococcus sp. KM273129]
MTGLAVDQAAWGSAWRGRSPGDKLLLCAGLVGCALLLPAWPGSVLVGLAAVALALGPARVPARTFGRAIRWPLAFIAIGALTAVVAVGDGGIGWAPDAAERAGSLVGRAVAGSAAVLLLATTTPMSDLLPELRRLRVPAAVVEVAGVTYRLVFVLLESLGTIREAQAARMGWSSPRRSYRSAGVLAAAVLTRSWDRARRMQDGLAGRGMETGLRVLPDALPSSRPFVALALALPAAITALTLVAR